MTPQAHYVDRLHGLRETLSAHVARRDMPGCAWLVSHGEEVHSGAIGHLDFEGAPMPRDAIFRISSMTKPMCAAVAMMLVEDGTLTLDAPVNRWLPELANRRVLRAIDGPLADTVPAERAITVRDLLTFRMGFGIVWMKDDLPIVRAANEMKLGAFGPPHVQEPPANDEWLRRFATLPLMEQPGARWRYNTSAEVLGILLARASGKSLGALLRERLTDPLGMRDTAFFVPPEKMGRLTTSYMTNAAGAHDLYDAAQGGEWSHAPAFESAGAGLVSTLDDCFAFARMMQQGGELGRARVLSRESVDAMTRDQLSASEKEASPSSLDPEFFRTMSWGLGCAIVTKPIADGPIGAGWDGGLGTSMWWSPSTIAILLTQRAAYPSMNPIYRDFWRGLGSQVLQK